MKYLDNIVPDGESDTDDKKYLGRKAVRLIQPQHSYVLAFKDKTKKLKTLTKEEQEELDKKYPPVAKRFNYHRRERNLKIKQGEVGLDDLV